MYDELIG